MATVRAKFKLNRVESTLYMKKNETTGVHEEVEMKTLVLQPVYSSDKTTENYNFWDATPSGEIKLGIVKPEGHQMFVIGKEYYVDFSPAE